MDTFPRNKKHAQCDANYFKDKKHEIDVIGTHIIHKLTRNVRGIHSLGKTLGLVGMRLRNRFIRFKFYTKEKYLLITQMSL